MTTGWYIYADYGNSDKQTDNLMLMPTCQAKAAIWNQCIPIKWEFLKIHQSSIANIKMQLARETSYQITCKMSVSKIAMEHVPHQHAHSTIEWDFRTFQHGHKQASPNKGHWDILSGLSYLTWTMKDRPGEWNVAKVDEMGVKGREHCFWQKMQSCKFNFPQECCMCFHFTTRHSAFVPEFMLNWGSLTANLLFKSDLKF